MVTKKLKTEKKVKEVVKEETIETPIEEEIILEDACPEIVEDFKAIVINSNGLIVRTYELSIHGEDYKSLAEQFASKFNYSIK